MKSKYHPWIYIIIFCIINPPGAPSIISGFIVGYLYVFGLLAFLQIEDGTAKSLEESFIFATCAQEFETFIKVEAASRNNIEGGSFGGMPNYARQENEQNNQAAPNTNKGGKPYTAFAGKGVKLGGESKV